MLNSEALSMSLGTASFRWSIFTLGSPGTVLFLFRCTGVSTELITFSISMDGRNAFSNGIRVRLIEGVRPNRPDLQICGPTKRI